MYTEREELLLEYDSSNMIFKWNGIIEEGENDAWKRDWKEYKWYTRSVYYALNFHKFANKEAIEALKPVMSILDEKNKMAHNCSISNKGEKLWPHQTSMVNLLMKNPWTIFDDPPRSGKTRVICSLIQIMKYKCSIAIVPRNAMGLNGTWYKEATKFTNSRVILCTTGNKTIEVMESYLKEKEPPPTLFLMTAGILINNNVLHKLKRLPIDLICIDEIIRGFAAKGNISFKAIRKIIAYRSIERPIKSLIGISATVFNTNKIARMVAYCLLFSSIIDKRPRHGIRAVNDVMAHFKQPVGISYVRHPKALGSYMKDVCIISRQGFERDIDKYFNMKMYSIKERNKEIQESYKSFSKLSSSAEDVITIGMKNNWHETATAQRSKDIIERAEYHLQRHNKIIIACWHRSIIIDVSQHFGVVPYFGGTSSKARTKIVDDFQNGVQRVFVGQILSCCENLRLDKATIVIFAELYWTPDKIIQMMHRQRCFTDTNKKDVELMILTGIDTYIVKVLGYHQDMVDKIMGVNND